MKLFFNRKSGIKFSTENITWPKFKVSSASVHALFFFYEICDFFFNCNGSTSVVYCVFGFDFQLQRQNYKDFFLLIDLIGEMSTFNLKKNSFNFLQIPKIKKKNKLKKNAKANCFVKKKWQKENQRANSYSFQLISQNNERLY